MISEKLADQRRQKKICFGVIEDGERYAEEFWIDLDDSLVRTLVKLSSLDTTHQDIIGEVLNVGVVERTEKAD